MVPKGSKEKNKQNSRPPSATSKNTKQQENKKTKPKTNINDSAKTPKKTISKSKEKSTNLKTLKIPKSMDNTLDNKEDMGLLNITQDKVHNKNDININTTINNNKSSRENFDQSFRNINLNNQTHISNIDDIHPIKIPEIIMTPNISAINKLLDSSQHILTEQKNIMENFSQLNKNIAETQYEVERLGKKVETEDFSQFINKYSDCLYGVINKLNLHDEELENIKCNAKLFLY